MEDQAGRVEAHLLSDQELLLMGQALARGVGIVGRHARPGLALVLGEMGCAGRRSSL